MSVDGMVLDAGGFLAHRFHEHALGNGPSGVVDHDDLLVIVQYVFGTSGRHDVIFGEHDLLELRQ